MHCQSAVQACPCAVAPHQERPAQLAVAAVKFAGAVLVRELNESLFVERPTDCPQTMMRQLTGR